MKISRTQSWRRVYMRKLAPARVSYRDDFLISYRILPHLYYWLGHFIYRVYMKIYFIIDKIHVWFKSQTLRMRYPFQSTGRPISHRNEKSFRVNMISRNLVPENSHSGKKTGVNSPRCDSRRHDILWWYHVNKFRATRGKWISKMKRRGIEQQINTKVICYELVESSLGP